MHFAFQRITTFKNLLSGKKTDKNKDTAVVNYQNGNVNSVEIETKTEALQIDNKLLYESGGTLSELECANHDHPLKEVTPPKPNKIPLITEKASDTIPASFAVLEKEVNTVALDWKSIKNVTECSCSTPLDHFSRKADETSEAVQKINEDLQRVVEWSEENSLVLNPLKSKFMVLGSRNQVRTILTTNPALTVMGESIERVELVCNLGLTMDPELRFEAHINNVLRNCFYRLKVLYGIRKYLSIPLRKQLVDSLILSRLNYCDIVYGPCLLSRTEHVIQRIQNACVRFCTNIPRRSHVTPYINELDLLKMAARRRLHLANLLFGVINSKKPDYLYSKLTWKPIRSDHGLRSVVCPLVVPMHRTTAFRGCFKFAATRCWNDIPPPLRRLKSKLPFKYLLKKHLLRDQNG
uniref:Reverse transcriptase domain-containing protein n=1 Tax=Heliothis virescens TaxID=7102 RepID=A0A2A4IZ43_HELVI